MNRYAAVRTDNMMGTRVGTHLVSLRYESEIENGNVLMIGALEEDSREVREASVPGVATPLRDLALIASVEMIKDRRDNQYDISEFINLPETTLRGYRFAQHDIFSVTPEALNPASADPEVGQFAFINGSTQIQLGAAASGTTIGRVIAVETESNDQQWIVIQVQ